MRDTNALHDDVFFRLAGEDEAHSLGVSHHHLVEQFGAIHTRHAHVGDDHIERIFRHQLQRLHAALRELHVPFLAQGSQHSPQSLQDHVFIVNKQDSFLHAAFLSVLLDTASGSRMMNVVPFPSSVSK